MFIPRVIHFLSKSQMLYLNLYCCEQWETFIILNWTKHTKLFRPIMPSPQLMWCFTMTKWYRYNIDTKYICWNWRIDIDAISSIGIKSTDTLDVIFSVTTVVVISQLMSIRNRRYQPKSKTTLKQNNVSMVVVFNDTVYDIVNIMDIDRCYIVSWT